MRKFIASIAPSGRGKPKPRSVRPMTLWAQNYDDAMNEARDRVPDGKRVIEVTSARRAGEETR